MEKMNVTASFEGDRQVQLRSMATEPRWSTISKEAKISSCPRAPGKALKRAAGVTMSRNSASATSDYVPIPAPPPKLPAPKPSALPHKEP